MSVHVRGCRVALVRHAPTAWSGVRYCGRSDPPLTEAGEAAAARVASDLLAALDASGRRRTMLVSSPLQRALASARPIQAVLGAPLIVDERWVEADMGSVDGRTWDELQAAEPDLAERLLAGETVIDWPGGETAADLAARVEVAWHEALALAADGPLVVVSHAGPIRLALALATRADVASVPLPAPATVSWVGAATATPSGRATPGSGGRLAAPAADAG